MSNFLRRVGSDTCMTSTLSWSVHSERCLLARKGLTIFLPHQDGYYIYTFSPSFADGQIGQPRWHRFRAPPRQPSAPPPTTPAPSASSSSRRSGNKKRQVHMSQDMMVDIDPQKKSDRSEVAFLHYDAIHNSCVRPYYH